ncbi:MAG: SDR family NAD(P)-dependent oxidoreductase [Pseudomonadota bacterium]
MFKQVVRPNDGAAWVTGASGGIGRAVTIALAERGWTVYATARTADALEDLATPYPGKIHPLPGDVTDLAAMRSAVSRITEQGPLALALLNAGIYHPMRAQTFDAEKARLTFDVNLTGVTNALEPVLAHMIARGSGHVALTASVAGYRGLPNAAPYGATKAGLIALAESLAMDLVDCGVRISVINPGFVETEATSVNEFEMPMLMQPEEAARAIVRGLERPGFEIRFPWIFAMILRLVGLLPNRAYIWTVRKLLGWDKIDA